MPFATSSFLLLAVRPLLLVAMPLLLHTLHFLMIHLHVVLGPIRLCHSFLAQTCMNPPTYQLTCETEVFKCAAAWGHLELKTTLEGQQRKRVRSEGLLGKETMSTDGTTNL